MQATVIELSEILQAVMVEITADEVDAKIEEACTELRKTVKIDGFRAGKAPVQLIKHAYKDAIRDTVARRFYEQTFYKTIEEHKLTPCNSPSVKWDVLEEGAPSRYRALFEVMPEIRIENYTGLTVTREKFSLDPDIVEEELRHMQFTMAELVPVDDDTTVENDHTVVFDYTYSVDGHPDMDAGATGVMLELGTGAMQMFPGFEEQLMGIKRGESKEIRVPLSGAPDGVEGVFQITVNEIKRRKLPELDDELAKQCSGCETMEALREKMTEYLRQQEWSRIEFKLQEDLIGVMIERNPLEVPQTLVNAQLGHMLESYKRRLQGEDSTSTMTEFTDLDEDDFRTRFSDSAEKKVKGDLLLMALVEKENLGVTDEDLAERYERIAAGDVDRLKQAREYHTSNHEAMNALLADIKLGKAIAFLQEHAVITEAEAADVHAP